MKKFFSVLLIVTFALCMMSAGVAAFDDLQPTADPSTLNGWDQWFGDDAVNTNTSGGVWTDKSVFAGGNGSVSIDDHEIAVGDDDFIVALSMISNNKMVFGHTYNPTDTILVLDVSNSMTVADVNAMISSVNSAINKLQELNVHNRVGVILYSTGRSVVLPLDRYTDTDIPAGKTAEYISAEDLFRYYNNGWILSGNIVVNDDIVGTDNADVSGRSASVGGGTFIQAGLDYAFDYLNSADTIIPEDDEFQAGVSRIPVIVLMSDGEPTYATSNYANVGSNNLGTGSASSERIVFATQLTFSYVRDSLAEKYGKDPLIYTLGLGVGSSNLAINVLDPATDDHPVSGLDTIWRDFLADGEYSWGSGKNARSIEQADGHDVTSESRYYVNEYFEADDSIGLINAFESIVETIVLQSAYYPTKVEGDINYSGYVTIIDDLGMGMQVKDVKGMILGDRYYTGESFARLFSDGEGSFGSGEETATAMGHAFVDAVCTRLNIDRETAQYLINDAYDDGTLYCELDDDNNVIDFNNLISYYADAEGNYLGYCDKDSRLDPSATLSAEDAEKAMYIFDTYGYIDSTNEEQGSLLYVSVAVRATLNRDADGNVISYSQYEVLWQVPASMVPMLTREFVIEGNVLARASKVTMTENEASPLRLIFEVGIHEGLDEYNITELLGENCRNTDGTYTLTTNAYDIDALGGDIEHPSEEINTVAFFHPNERNERYYYSEHSLIYTDDKGTAYVGTSAPVGDGYFRKVIEFSWNEDRSEVTYGDVYEPIHANTLKEAVAVFVDENGDVDADSTWIIPAGTPRNIEVYGDILRVEKTNNTTDTLKYSLYGDSEVDADGTYLVDIILGNNGVLGNLKPATGIKISKEVTDTVEGVVVPAFTFTIETDAISAITTVPVVKEVNGVKTAATPMIFTAEGYGEVTVNAGESVYISDLPVGSYTVKEKAVNDYTLVSVNGETADSASVEVKTHEIAELDFVNKYEPKEDYTLQARYHIEEITDAPHSSSEVVTLEEGSDWAIQKGGFDATINAPKVLIVDGVIYAYDETANGGEIIRGTITEDTVVDLIYSKDAIGTGDDLDHPDGTPDKYQVTVNYVADANGSVAPLTKEVITLIVDGKASETKDSIDVCGSGTEAIPATDYAFDKWTFAKNSEAAADTDLPAELTLQKIANVKGGDVYTYTAYFTVADGSYTVEHYKWDETAGEYRIVSEDTEVITDQKIGTEVSAVPNTYDGYAYNPQAEGTLTKGVVPGADDNALVLKLYYDIDVIGEEDPEEPDNIPDKYQATVEYVVTPADKGEVSLSKEVITLKDGDKWAERAEITASGSTVTPVEGWVLKDWTDESAAIVGTDAVLGEQTIAAAGGEVYTYTATLLPKPVPVVPSSAAYTVEHYKWNPDTAAYEIVEADTEVKFGKIGETVTAEAKDYSADGYVWNPNEAQTVASGVVRMVTTADDQSVDMLTLKLYYDLDSIGEEDPEEPDNIPDKYQVTVIYRAAENGAIAEGALTEEVITIYDADGKTSVENGDVVAAGSSAVADAGYQFAKWTLAENDAAAADTAITSDTFSDHALNDVNGGDVFTFTAYFEDIPAPGVDVVKTADKAEAEAGDVITYTITVTNTGNVDLYNLIVKDTMVYADGTPVAGTFDNTMGTVDGNVNTFVIEKLPVGANESVTYSYTYTVDVADGDKVLVNTAEAFPGDNDEPLDSDEVEVPVEPFLPGLEYDDHFAYIIGYEDGTVRPNGNITRAEVATIFFRLLDENSRNLCLTDENNFADVNVGDWHNNAISTLVKAGVLNGYLRADGTYEFRPNEPIKRSELAAIATRFDTVMKNEAADSNISFTDVDASHWAYDEIMTAAARGWVTGELQTDGTYIFRPDDNIRRCEAMQLINNVLLRSVDEAGVAAADAAASPYYNVWSDNSDTTAWYYYVVQEATNSHDWAPGDRVNDKLTVGDSVVYFENWIVVQEAPDWAAWQEALTK